MVFDLNDLEKSQNVWNHFFIFFGTIRLQENIFSTLDFEYNNTSKDRFIL